MTLQNQVAGFLRATDPSTRLTYSRYSADLIERGHKPITPQQWDLLADILGDRKLIDTGTEANWRENMSTALAAEVANNKVSQCGGNDAAKP